MRKFIVGALVVAGAFAGGGIANAGGEDIPYQPLERGLYHTGHDGVAFGSRAQSPEQARADYFEHEALVWEGHSSKVN